jgi:hypothetical protein
MVSADTDMYEHRQLGITPLLIVVGVTLVAIIVSVHAGAPALCALVVILVAAGGAFSSMTVRVSAAGVDWAYTFGLPRGHLDFRDIDRVEPVTTNLLEGWGIHWTWWHGWLWNVSGFDAVEIHRRGAGPVTLGTNDVAGLYDAIERYRRSSQT